MYQLNVFKQHEGDSDPDKKKLALEQRSSQLEKTLLMAFVVVALFAWHYFDIQETLKEVYRVDIKKRARMWDEFEGGP